MGSSTLHNEMQGFVGLILIEFSFVKRLLFIKVDLCKKLFYSLDSFGFRFRRLFTKGYPFFEELPLIYVIDL